MQKFAQHTRHTEAECENDPSAIARKYLICHLAGSDGYAHVSDDYDAMAIRTQKPPLSAYREMIMEPDDFVRIMRDGYDAPIDTHDAATPHLGAFCDALFPAPVGEEGWERLQRTDHWKARACFVASQLMDRPGVHELVHAVVGDEAFTDTWARMRSYHDEIGAHSPPISAREWGAIINPLTHLESIPTSDAIPVAQEQQKEAEEVASVIPEEKLNLASSITATEQDWNSVRVHPTVASYRGSVLISPIAPTPKVVKQMVLSGMGVTPVPPVVLVTGQETPPAVMAVEDRKALISFVSNHLVMNVVDKMDLNAPEIRSAHHVASIGRETPLTAGELLREATLHYIRNGVPDEGWNATQKSAYARHMKEYPTAHPSLVSSVLSL